MRSLFRFLLRNYFLMMFLALEAISLVLMVSFNNYQRVTFFNSSSNLAGTVYEKFSSFDDYFSLSRTNARLAAENASLHKQLQLRIALQEKYPVWNTVRLMTSCIFLTKQTLHTLGTVHRLLKIRH